MKMVDIGTGYVQLDLWINPSLIRIIFHKDEPSFHAILYHWQVFAKDV